MKVIPVKPIKNLVNSLFESANESNKAGFEFTMNGSYTLDKDGEIGFALQAETDIPFDGIKAEVTTGIKRIFDNQYYGNWSLKVWSDPEK